jgi:hypothetical protein
LAGFILGASIELLAKLHDIQAFTTKRRSNRRRGVCGTSLYLKFQVTSNFFGHLVCKAVAVVT